MKVQIYISLVNDENKEISINLLNSLKKSKQKIESIKVYKITSVHMNSDKMKDAFTTAGITELPAAIVFDKSKKVVANGIGDILQIFKVSESSISGSNKRMGRTVSADDMHQYTLDILQDKKLDEDEDNDESSLSSQNIQALIAKRQAAHKKMHGVTEDEEEVKPQKKEKKSKKSKKADPEEDEDVNFKPTANASLLNKRSNEDPNDIENIWLNKMDIF